MASPAPYKKSLSLQRSGQPSNQGIHSHNANQGMKPTNKSLAPRFPASTKNIDALKLTLTNKTAEKAGSGFLPPAIQTTCSYSPDFPQVVKRDTRPPFLGGQYTSKVKGISEVSQYINHSLHNRHNAEMSGLGAANDIDMTDASKNYDV